MTDEGPSTAQKNAVVDEEIFTTQEAVEFADVAARTLRRWAKEGMRTERRSGRPIYFKSELRKYMHGERRRMARRMVRKITATEIELLFKEVDASIAALSNVKARLKQILS